MLHQHLFDLGGVHVEPRHDDEVLHSVDEVQVAPVVDGGDITGHQPALGVDRTGGGVLVVPVAGEDVRAPDPQLAGVTDQHVVAVLVDEAQLQTGDRHTDRPDGGVGAHGRRDHRRCLGEPVALGQVDVVTALHRAGDLVGQTGGTRHGETHGIEGVFGRLGKAGPRRPHGGRAGDDRRLVLLDRLDRGDRVEALDEQQPGADGERHPEHHVQPEDVEHRQHREHHVVGTLGIAGRGQHLGDIGAKVAVREHRRLG